MIVYHGSPNKFNEFDYARIRTNGTSEGIGFYFTDNKQIAAGYGSKGYLYTVELNGNKSLSDNEKTLTESELRLLLIELNNRIDFLSNYGEVAYEGLENVLNIAIESEFNYNDTDTEIMGSLYNAAGENELIIHLFHELLGYDHIVSVPDWGKQKLYIALTNDIINIIDIEEI